MVNQEALTNLRITTVNQIEELLKEHDRVATVWCTGLGKSRYLIYPLCQRLPGKKLILEPSVEIISYLSDLEIKDYNSQFITYHKLVHSELNDLIKEFSKYDYIFLDEVHRALAEKWGKVLSLIFKAIDRLPGTIKVLGFTATEIRMDGKNVVEEIFNNVQTEPIGLMEAILENYLPNPEYHCGLYEITTKEKERILKLNDEPLKNQILNYDIDDSIENIFRENLDLNNDHKIICFVDKIKNINEAINNIRKWIKKDINVYQMHSKQSNYVNNEQKELFKNTSGLNIMFTVNKLNEGVHFENIDSVIFLRKTESNIIYLQQLGRVLSDKSENPKVFDLVNNINNLDASYTQLINKKAKELKIELNDLKTKNGERLKIVTHQIELIKALKLSRLRDFSRICEENKDFILQHKDDMMPSEIARNLGIDGKHRGAFIIRFYEKENITEFKGSVEQYSKEEDRAILNNLDKPVSELSKLKELKNRTRRSIESHMINVLRIEPVYDSSKKVFWTKEEDNLAYELHKTHTAAQIAKIISKKYRKVTTAQVQDRCNKYLNIKCLKEDSFIWTEEMIKKLKELVKTMSMREISDQEGWPYTIVKHKINKLGIKAINYRSKDLVLERKKERIKKGLEDLSENISMAEFFRRIKMNQNKELANIVKELDLDNKIIYKRKD